MPIHRRLAGAAALCLLAAAPASAFQVEITVENLIQEPGFSLTPVYFGFHDGGFDAFDVGAAASPELADLAEIGVFGGLAGLRQASQPGTTVGAVVASPAGPPPLEPGARSSAIVDLDPTDNRALSYFTMLVPTNDTFAGNDDPTQFLLFDDQGNYNGDFDIIVTTAGLYDAGSELNDPSPTGGAAFLASAIGTEGGEENGVITQLDAAALQEIFDAFDGLTTAAGTTVAGPTLGSAPFELARISVNVRPRSSSVPVPAAAPLLGGALAVFGAMRRRKPAA